MHVIIGGCGRVGAQLADQLSRDEHDVVIIDSDAEAFDRIGSAFNGETLIGNIIDKGSLVRAGIEHADALAAVTDLDNANLMSVQIARELFSVRVTIARLFNPQREDSYRKMGVSYVSGTRLVARAIICSMKSMPQPSIASARCERKAAMPLNGRPASAWRNGAGTETRPFASTLFSKVPIKIATWFPCGSFPACLSRPPLRPGSRPNPGSNPPTGKNCRSLPLEWDNLGYHGISWVSMPPQVIIAG